MEEVVKAGVHKYWNKIIIKMYILANIFAHPENTLTLGSQSLVCFQGLVCLEETWLPKTKLKFQITGANTEINKMCNMLLTAQQISLR